MQWIRGAQTDTKDVSGTVLTDAVLSLSLLIQWHDPRAVRSALPCREEAAAPAGCRFALNQDDLEGARALPRRDALAPAAGETPSPGGACRAYSRMHS